LCPEQVNNKLIRCLFFKHDIEKRKRTGHRCKAGSMGVLALTPQGRALPPQSLSREGESEHHSFRPTVGGSTRIETGLGATVWTILPALPTAVGVGGQQ
jgi:hypothetical protein